LKEKILINLSRFSQKKMNSRKIPKKFWKQANFSNLQIFSINNSILRGYFSSDIEKHKIYESFSWTMNKINGLNDFIQKTTEKNFEFNSVIKNDKNIKFCIEKNNESIQLFVNNKITFSMTISYNNEDKWILIEKNLKNIDYKYFGFGEQTNPLDKKGKRIIFWNTDNPGYKIGANPLYQSWPIIIFQTFDYAWALVFDNPAYSEINMTEKEIIKYYVNDAEINFYLLLGPSMKDIMEQNRLISGSISAIPKWSLGYQQSRWSYTPSSRVREIANTFREKNIPCDVIYLDIDYMDNYKCFTFGPDFNDYEKLVDELHSQGFKVIPIIDPGIKKEEGYFVYDEGLKNKFFITNSKGEIITIKVWPGESHFPDFVNSSVQNWWATLVANFITQSKVDGIWCDMNEPSTFDARRTLQPDAKHFMEGNNTISHEKLHNIFGYLMSKATYDGLAKLTPNPYVLTRSTYLGGQKYAVTWTGDNVSSWSHLQASIPMILSLGLSGQPIVGPDIGGFNGTPDPKLYDRWITQGAFYPFSRSHTVKDTPDQEPWSFGLSVEEKAQKAITLRYKLIPFYYSLLYEAFEKGYPILRPIFFNDLNETTLDKNYYETQFLIGDSLLFTPFMSKSSKRDIYLPPGIWYSWFSKDNIYEGDSFMSIEEEDFELLPIFIKENSIIPMYTKNLQFVPDTSQTSLSFYLVVKDSKIQGNFNFIEYFDKNCILGIKISMEKEKNFITVNLEEIKQGKIPENCFLPTEIHLHLNYFIRKISNLDKETFDIKTDKDDWSKITFQVTQYPVTLVLETLF
jgi:alpha-glucosidase